MGRNLDDVIISLPQEERGHVDTGHSVLMQEVEGLRALRQFAGKAQAEVAAALNIKQPSVSKIEKQADMHISTLRSYVEAVGGTLELTVRLPRRPTIRIHALGDDAAVVSNKLTARRASFAKAEDRK